MQVWSADAILAFLFGSEDALTREEALQMLREMESGKNSREERMINRGYPAYTTSAGAWDDLCSYSDVNCY